MKRRSAFASVAAAVLATCASSCQSSTADFADPPGEEDRWTLGELVYEILHANLERADECSPEMVAELEANRDRFVETFDYTISNDIVNDLPDLLGGTILPLVDSGEMPRLTDAVAQALALLIDDELDRDRKALRGIVAMSKVRTVLAESQAIELVGRVLADPTIEDEIHALAGLALEDDGADLAASSMLDLARRLLAEPDEPSACTGIETEGLAERLLQTEGFTPDPALGAPAWSARVDANGNPLVRVDPTTGRLYEPFVDADGDGVADVDDRGRPVDEAGQAIDIPVLGTVGARDSQGRALGHDGGHLYEYYDVKQTLLAHLVARVREAGEAGIHHDFSALVEAALGEQLPCSDGTGTCYRYPSTHHPLADAAWMGLELARYERAAVLLQTIAALVRDNPDVAERLLVAMGDLMQALEDSGLDIADPELLDVVIDLAPLLADIFAADNTTGESTARLLLDVVHELGDTAREFPEQLETTVDYARLHKADECSADPPDLSMSTPVDYDQPRFVGSGASRVDNRSSLEQSVELLDHADCGEVPFTGGKSVAYVLLDIMADQEPGTVCNLVDLFLGAIDVIPSAGRWVTVEALDLIGCDGEVVYDHLQALDDLAKSGALDFYVPVLRVFKERGQLPLVLEIFHYLGDDLRKDEDADPATRSAIRRLLPVIQDLLDTEAAQVLFDVLDLLVTIEAVDGDGTLADVTIDAADYALRDDEDVRTRQGTVTGTSVAVEMLRPMRDMVARVDAAGGGEHVDAIVDFLRGYLTRTRTVGEERRLADPNLIPMLAEGLDVAGQTVDLPRDDFVCWVDELQTGSEELLTEREFATAVRLLRVLSRSEHGPLLESWLLGLFEPRPDAPDEEVLGMLLQVVAAFAQSDLDTTHLDGVLRWVGTVAGQRSADGPELIRIVDDMLASDENDVALTIGRTLFSPGPLPGGEAPMSTFGGVLSDVGSIRPDDMCLPGDGFEYDAADAEDLLRSVVEFMQDEETGLGAVYDLVGRRSTEVDGESVGR